MHFFPNALFSNTTRGLLILVMAILPLVFAGASVQAQETGTPPPEVDDHQEEWPLAHQNYRNHRAAVASSIDLESVDDLGVSWTFPIPGRADFGAAASAPLVIDDTVYFQDLASNVFALDLETGELQWEQRYDAPVTGPNGPGVGYGKLFIASGIDTFAALDLETGEEVWSVEPGGDRPTGDIQPYIYDDKVYITSQAGVAGPEGSGVEFYEAGRSGHIFALDPETGETLWHFQTVQEDFWGHPEINSGAGVWYSPLVDTERGLTIWGTGNPAPFPGTVDFPNAASRPEPNLYANSLVALDAETGDLIWYNYANPNDLFDADVQISPMLVTTTIEGEARELVVGSGKVGDIIALDPESGETVWRTPVGRHQNDDLTAIPEDLVITVYPGLLGGVLSPMAYADGTIYAPVINTPTEYTATAFGSESGTETVATALEHTEIGSGTSELVAVDAATGIILWTHAFDSENYGGATVVNDLVFTATADGVIHALDRATGEEVWSHQAPAGINAWPAVVGDTILWPAGLGENASLVALRLDPDNKAVARMAFEEPWNQGDLDAVDEYFASDYVGHDPAFPTVQGVDGQKQLIAMVRAGFPDLHFTVEEQFATGDMVANRWTATGTHEGEFMGIAATGNPITVTGVTINRIVDGKLAESWTNWDVLGLLQQIGAMPTSE